MSEHLVSQLLARWEAAKEEGENLSVEELCREHPDLIEEVREQVGMLEAFDAALQTDRHRGTDPNGAAGMARTVTTGVRGGPDLLPEVAGYELLGVLGKGGMGVVYRAVHRPLKRAVALKMILAGGHAGADDLARFRTEAEAIARLRHPNIVQIYEVGEAGGCPFFSLEFVDGGSLDRRIAGTPQPPTQAARVVAVLARAMHFAHQAGVIHRDLKPANVLLSRKPGTAWAEGEAEPPLETFEPKITDFGLAKRLGDDSGQTRSGAIMGTPSYMAPEQADGRAADIGPVTDVYALTAILYELLTGRPPFKGATLLDTLMDVRTGELVPPTRLQPKVPRDLETICLKGLRKEPRQRYASAGDLADDLQRWLDGRPIQARPVTGWERAWKWARRRPALAALAVGALVALLIAAVGAVCFGLYKSQQANALVEQARRSGEVERRWELGQEAEAADRLDAAKEHWDRAVATLEADPGAAGADTRRRLEDGVERLRGRLAARQQLQERLRRFGERRDQALFRAVSPGRHATDDDDAVRREAPAALAELGLDASDPQALAAGLSSFRGLADAAQLRRLAEDCVELLLTWAGAEATAPDGGTDRALRILDGAAALGRVQGLPESRALHATRARCLELLGQAEAASTEQRRAADIPPATALDYFQAALADYGAGRVEEASAACAQALRLRSAHYWAQYVKALCYLRAQRWGEAEVSLSVCLDQRPNDAWLWSLLGMAHGGLKKFPAAEEDFERALRASSDPALQAAALTNRSAVRLLRGRAEDAERDLRRAIELRPNDYQGHVNLAQVLQRRGDPDGALEHVGRAVDLRGDDPALYYLRAGLQVVRGDRAAARRDFERGLAREPKDSRSDRAVAARIDLAHLRHHDGEDALALADCDAVLAVRRDFAEAHRERAEVLVALRRNDEAAAALDRYLAADPRPTPAAYRARGLLHAGRHDYGAAVTAYTRALLLEEDAATLTDRGWALLMQEPARAALADFDAALRLRPAHPDALAGRGAALMMRGRPADLHEATAAAEKALRAAPATVPRLMACARIYAVATGVLGSAGRLADDPETARCARRAVALLGEALRKLPEQERTAFWRDGILADPALRTLERTPDMLQLARTYGR